MTNWELINAAIERERAEGQGEVGNEAHKRLSVIWQGMRQRCGNANDDGYAHYGARGISVCDEWQDFEAFFDWSMANGYEPHLTIDRENNDLGYSPANCRWFNYTQQGRNKRNNVLIEINGVSRCASEWAEIVGLRYGTLLKRFHAGVRGERLLAPVTARKMCLDCVNPGAETGGA